MKYKKGQIVKHVLTGEKFLVLKMAYKKGDFINEWSPDQGKYDDDVYQTLDSKYDNLYFSGWQLKPTKK